MHADADSLEATDWPQIVALYDQLLTVAPTPVVALNRAIAVSEVDGPAAALELVDSLDLSGYHPFHATRATCCAVCAGPARPSMNTRRQHHWHRPQLSATSSLGKPAY